MGLEISRPPEDEHIAACGLFCTNCGKFKKGRCQGCQIEAGVKSCKIRSCCIEKEITTCADCDEFAAPRSYKECKNINNFIAKIFALIFRSDRPAGLAMIRDEGAPAFIEYKRLVDKM